MKIYILTATFFALASAAKEQYRAPVAILKQIDKHNEDGSYTYGYEDADGTFKIETKYPDGEVYGKYGYIDDTGALREVEYGASRRGFEPAGNEIQVAPPTLRNDKNAARPLGPEEEDDGQYREDPSVYYKNDPYAQPQKDTYQQSASRYQRPQSYYAQPEYEPEPEYRPAYKPAYSKPQSIYKPQSVYKPQSLYTRAEPAYRPEPVFRPEPAYRPEPSYRPEPAYRPEPTYRPSYQPPAPQPTYAPSYTPQSNYGFSNNNNNYSPPPTYNTGFGNVDWHTGSYSVNYKR